MKKSLSIFWVLAIAFIGLAQPLYSQNAKEVFNSSETPVTYLGIDFTQARLIGDAGAIANDFKEKYFPGINQVVVNEPKKYDLPKTFKKTTITNDITVTEAANAKIDAEKIKSPTSSEATRLDAAAIQKVVQEYNLAGKKGIGIVFIMEDLNKTAEKGTMHVTFIDMATRKVLFTERMSAKAGGFGYKNYWAKTVYGVMEQIEKSKYKEWQKKNA